MRNQTMRRRGALALLVCVASACGSDPDPREVAARLVAEQASRSDQDRPLVEVAELHRQPPPAPAVETAARVRVPELQSVTVAVGHHAAQTLNPVLERAAAATCPELAGHFAACSDRDAVELLMVGRAGFAVIGGTLSPGEIQAGLCQTRLGLELFALAVAEDSPVRSLTRMQVRQVLTGETTHWPQLGYDGGAITVLVPADRNLAERAAHVLMPGDDFPATVMRVDSERQTAVTILKNRDAIGIVRALDRPPEAGQRLLQIHWSAPTVEAFDYGAYPFAQPVHLVTSGPPSGTGLKFLEFVRSEEGRSLLRGSLLVR